MDKSFIHALCPGRTDRGLEGAVATASQPENLKMLLIVLYRLPFILTLPYITSIISNVTFQRIPYNCGVLLGQAELVSSQIWTVEIRI